VDSPKSSASAQPSTEKRECFACYEGVVYLGELVEGEDREEVEGIEAVPCRKCSG
jgi:hypothetical protein